MIVQCKYTLQELTDSEATVKITGDIIPSQTINKVSQVNGDINVTVLGGSTIGQCVIFRETGGDYDLNFHNAPRRQYVVNLSGSVEIEVGSGERRVLGPGSILLAEDTTGQGHISRAVDRQPRQSLFIPLADTGSAG